MRSRILALLLFAVFPSILSCIHNSRKMRNSALMIVFYKKSVLHSANVHEHIRLARFWNCCCCFCSVVGRMIEVNLSEDSNWCIFQYNCNRWGWRCRSKRFPAELQLPLFIFILLLLTYRETECASHAALRVVNFSVAFPFCRSVAIKWKVNSILISISCYVLNEKFY